MQFIPIFTSEEAEKLRVLLADAPAPPAPTPSPAPPPVPVPPPPPSPSPPAPTESPSGSEIPPLGTIEDSAGDVWSLGAIVGNLRQPLKNGALAGPSNSLCDSILYVDGQIYCHSSNGHWYKWNAGNWADNGTVKPSTSAPPPQSNANTLFSDMVGLGVKFQQGQPVSELATLTDLGVKWIRSDVWFSDFVPATGQFAANTTLQAMAGFCATNNIGIIAIIQMGSYDPVVFARFVVEVAKYLKTTGVKFVMELGNEPHNSSIVGQFGGSWQGAGPSPWLTQYVNIVNEAVTALRALDPTIKTLSDDDMWVTSYWMLEAGLTSNITGMAFHPYPGGADRPEQTAVQWNTDWCAPFQVVDADSSFGSAVRRLRTQATTKLAKQIEMWATEMGFNQAGGIARETLIASYVPRAFILASEAGVDNFCWFSSQDGPDGPMGLKTNDLVKRPAYDAFKTMTQQLGAYKRAKRIAGAGRPLVGIQAFVLDGSSNRKVVVWTSDNTSITAGSPAPVSSAVVDIFGVAKQNNPTMQFTGAPTYFTTSATDAELSAWAASL